MFKKNYTDITLHIPIVFHYVFQIAPRGDRHIFGSHIVLHCSGLAVRHSLHTHLFPEARAQRLLVCGHALLAEARTRSNTIEIYIFNKHKHINIPSFYIMHHIISHKHATLIGKMNSNFHYFHSVSFMYRQY